MLHRTNELLNAAEIGKLRLRREGPFRITAPADPHTYVRAVPMRFKCSRTVNVECLRSPNRTTIVRITAIYALGPVTDQGQEGKYEMKQLLI